MQLPRECTAKLGTRNLLFMAPLLGLLAVVFWTPALLSWAYLHYAWPQLEASVSQQWLGGLQVAGGFLVAGLFVTTQAP